jgi:hypothetical protein
MSRNRCAIESCGMLQIAMFDSRRLAIIGNFFFISTLLFADDPTLDVLLRPHSLVRAMVFSRRQRDQDKTLHGIGNNPIAVRCVESLYAISN